jgi:predicted enzyme related to lactoylglutathione lyase
MSERTRYAPGTFSWTDLTTTDQDAAKAFYMPLLGWEADDRAVGEGVVYSMMLKHGKQVAAISPQPQAQREMGAPPLWNSYVTVASADDAAARAAELGANVHVPPFDVMEAGRMAAIQDPQGAWFLVWQPNENIGAQLVNVPGALCWNELASPDLDGSADFYGALFGWQTAPFEGSDQPYLVIQNDGRANGGIRDVMPPGTPPHWLVYFATGDLDASIAQVGELGGEILAGPISMSIARIAIVRDPQGAVFALYDGELEP